MQYTVFENGEEVKRFNPVRPMQQVPNEELADQVVRQARAKTEENERREARQAKLAELTRQMNSLDRQKADARRGLEAARQAVAKIIAGGEGEGDLEAARVEVANHERTLEEIESALALIRREQARLDPGRGLGGRVVTIGV